MSVTTTPPNYEQQLKTAIETRDVKLLTEVLNTKKNDKTFLKNAKKIIENSIDNYWEKSLKDTREQGFSLEKQQFEDSIMVIIKTLYQFNQENATQLDFNPLPIDFSFLSDSNLSWIFRQLLESSVACANWIINNSHKKNKIEIELTDYNILNKDLQIKLFLPEERKALNEFLTSQKITYKDELKKGIPYLIGRDIDAGVGLALTQNVPMEKIISGILRNDSANCFQALYSYLKTDSKHNVVIKKLLEDAIASHAPKCIDVILKNKIFSEKEIEEQANKAALDSNGVMVLVLCKNDYKKAAQYLFYDKLFLEGNQKELEDHLKTLMRFMPLEQVDKIVKSYLSDTKVDSKKKDLVSKNYNVVKKEFYEYAPYFSRYSNPITFKRFTQAYGTKMGGTFRAKALQDIEYGKERKALVEKQHKIMMETDILNFKPPPASEFAKLPPSSKNTRRAATLLRAFSIANAERTKNPIFSTLRDKRVKTPFHMDYNYGEKTGVFYDWGNPIIGSIIHNSHSIVKSNKPHSDSLYLMTYDSNKQQNLCVNDISFYNNENLFDISPGFDINHGKARVTVTWQNVEDVFEELLGMDLKKPAEHAALEEKTAYKDKLKRFNEKATELIWLIGNTTPLARGSGTYAELMLAFIYIHHGMNPTILRTKFPQLDVLDIIFPLEDYKIIFPYLNEPSSLPPSLVNEQMLKLAESDLSVEDEMNSIYQLPALKAMTPTNKIAVYDTEDSEDLSSEEMPFIISEVNQPIPIEEPSSPAAFPDFFASDEEDDSLRRPPSPLTFTKLPTEGDTDVPRRPPPLTPYTKSQPGEDANAIRRPPPLSSSEDSPKTPPPLTSSDDISNAPRRPPPLSSFSKPQTPLFKSKVKDKKSIKDQSNSDDDTPDNKPEF